MLTYPFEKTPWATFGAAGQAVTHLQVSLTNVLVPSRHSWTCDLHPLIAQSLMTRLPHYTFIAAHHDNATHASIHVHVHSIICWHNMQVQW